MVTLVSSRWYNCNFLNMTADTNAIFFRSYSICQKSLGKFLARENSSSTNEKRRTVAKYKLFIPVTWISFGSLWIELLQAYFRGSFQGKFSYDFGSDFGVPISVPITVLISVRISVPIIEKNLQNNMQYRKKDVAQFFFQDHTYFKIKQL